MDPAQTLLKEVQEYYGETLKTSADLQTNACCLGASVYTKSQKQVIKKIHDEILLKFYGCGSPVPDCIEGMTIVDLGCGSGKDVYLCSGLVGENGKVIGVDMTPNQIETAKKYQQHQTEQFGLSKPNTEFFQGTIEDLQQYGVNDETLDLVISNCVLNLCSDKKKVLKEVFRVLKWGGELFFSDVYSNKRIPQNLQNDKVLWGECLSGALYLEDFRRIAAEVGFIDIRVVKQSVITLENKQIEGQLAGYKFLSITYRCFKLKDIEDRCEDYGQSLTYNGGIIDCEQEFNLDQGHSFKKGQSYKVCGNTASMIKYSRFSQYFNVDERGEHQGLFNCSGGDCDQKKNECGESGSCC